jgi:hypothetical protein
VYDKKSYSDADSALNGDWILIQSEFEQRISLLAASACRAVDDVGTIDRRTRSQGRIRNAAETDAA